MYDNLFDEIACMRDAWGWTPSEALKFIGENLDMYSGLESEYESFMSVAGMMFSENTKGAAVH